MYSHRLAFVLLARRNASAQLACTLSAAALSSHAGAPMRHQPHLPTVPAHSLGVRYPCCRLLPCLHLHASVRLTEDELSLADLGSEGDVLLSDGRLCSCERCSISEITRAMALSSESGLAPCHAAMLDALSNLSSGPADVAR